MPLIEVICTDVGILPTTLTGSVLAGQFNLVLPDPGLSGSATRRARDRPRQPLTPLLYSPIGPVVSATLIM